MAGFQVATEGIYLHLDNAPVQRRIGQFVEMILPSPRRFVRSEGTSLHDGARIRLPDLDHPDETDTLISHTLYIAV
jgi:hypothetical protein